MIKKLVDLFQRASPYTESMQFQRVPPLNAAHSGGVWALAPISYHHYEQAGHFVTGGCDGRLRSWRLGPSDPSQGYPGDTDSKAETGEDSNAVAKCVRSFSKHSLPIVTVSTSRDRDIAISTSLDGAVKVWNIGSDATDPKSVQNTAAHDVWTAAISSDGERALTGGANGIVMVVDCTVCMVDHVYSASTKKTGIRVDTAPLRKDGPMVMSIALSDDDKYAVLGTADGSVLEMDIETGKIVSPPVQKHGGPVRSVSYIRGEQKTVVSASDDGLINAYDMGSGDTTATFRGHQGMVFSVAPSSNGRLLSSGGSDGRVIVWDRIGQRPSFTSTSHSDAIWGVSWTRSNDYIVSVSDDGKVGFVSCTGDVGGD